MTESEKKDLQILYQENAKAISDMKNRIWLVTYYILLIQSGIFGFYNIESIKSSICFFGKGLLFLITLVITIFGIILLKLFTSRLEYYQVITIKIRSEAFSETVFEIADAKEKLYKEKHSRLKWFNKNFNDLFFVAVCCIFIIGLLLSVWAMFGAIVFIISILLAWIMFKLFKKKND